MNSFLPRTRPESQGFRVGQKPTAQCQIKDLKLAAVRQK
jgi:hypothetical protein